MRLRGVVCALLLAGVALTVGGCFFLFPNTPPIARIVTDHASGLRPLTVQFDGTLSSDPDGSIRRYRWEFGDGGDAKGAMAQHTYSASGTYEATLTVTDSRGARATASVSIVVRTSNGLPIAAFSISPSPALPRQPIGFDAAASYDPDGSIVSYEWNFGDGTIGSGVQTVHWYEEIGTYTVTLIVTDDDGGARSTTAEAEVAFVIDETSTISRHYEWVYDGQAQSCDLEIPFDLYAYYKSQPRMVWAGRDYDEYVLDPYDDDYLEAITQEVLSTTAGDYHAALENALFFVQKCIRYVYDPLWFEYPRYPIETLVDGYGDCEDTAILYTSLVRTLGRGALMVVVDANKDGTVDHMVAWVPVEASFVAAHPDRSFWEYEGRTYAFAETAVEGGYLPLGVDPWGLTESNIDTIYDVSRVDHDPQAVRVGSGEEP
jgi:PKD repeat protein